MQQIHREVDALVAHELEEGERVLWTGLPLSVRRTTSPVTRTFLILTIVFGAIGIIMLIIAIIFTALLHTRGGADASLALYITGTVFLFLALIYGILAVTIRQNVKGIAYAITERRIISISTGNTLIVHSFGKNDIGPISRVERSDGSGDLTFALPTRTLNPYSYGYYGYAGTYGSYGAGNYGIRNLSVAANAGKFINIPDVHEVEHLVRRIFQ